jgi:uncharacterized membrane protein
MTKTVTQNRWKSPVLWTSLASAIIAFLLGAGVIDAGMSESLTTIVTLALTLLASFGIINSPTTKNGL